MNRSTVIGDFLVHLETENDFTLWYKVSVQEAAKQIYREFFTDVVIAHLTYDKLVLEYKLQEVERRVEKLVNSVCFQEKE